MPCGGAGGSNPPVFFGECVVTIVDYAGWFVLVAFLGAGWILFAGRDE